MSLTFANYHEVERSPFLDQWQKDVIHSMLCEKFIKMNNNPSLNVDLIKKNTNIINVNVHVYNSKQFIRFEIFIDFFDTTFALSLMVYFDESGKYNRWNSYYVGSLNYPQLMNILNINHFNEGKSHLEFSLRDDSDTQLYTIINYDDIRTPLYPHKRTLLKYYFNKCHTVHYKNVETKESKSTCTSNYTIEGFEKVETERLFIKFVQHMLSEKENVDAEFIDYSVFDFNDQFWVRKAHEMFSKNLTGVRRVPFFDYMKIIDMINI